MTRVSLTTHAPLHRSGTLSASGRRLQSIKSGAVRFLDVEPLAPIDHAGPRSLSVIRYERDKNAVRIWCAACFGAAVMMMQRGRYVVPPDFVDGISRLTSAAGLSLRKPS